MNAKISVFAICVEAIIYLLLYNLHDYTFKDFFSKCDQVRSFLLIWSNLLKKFLMENFIFCAVAFSLSTLKPTKI